MSALAMTPKRLAFLAEAAAGGITWMRVSYFGDGTKVYAGRGGLFVYDGEARKMVHAGWIEAVRRADGLPGTEVAERTPNGMATSYRYRVTERGRALLSRARAKQGADT